MTNHKRRKLAIFIIFMTLMVATSYTVYAYETGQFWSRITNTIVLTNTSNNVRIGVNQTSTYKLQIDGNTYSNGTLTVANKLTSYGELWIHNRTRHISNNNTYSYGSTLYYESHEIGFIPEGGIIMWSGSLSNLPDAWYLCDGTHGTPDLRGRFIVMYNTSYLMNETGGEMNHTLTIPEIPSHTHTYNAFGPGTVLIIGAGTRGQVTSNTGSTGGGLPHNNLPPYYALAYIMFTGYSILPP